MSPCFVYFSDRTKKILHEKEGNGMAGYIVTALSLDQRDSSSPCTIAASVFDSNGMGVMNLNEGNFTVHNITGEARFTIVEMQSSKIAGFYRLQLRPELAAHAGDCVLALMVTGRHHVVGRVPESIDNGHTMVRVKAV
jgi:hypothetical protein